MPTKKATAIRASSNGGNASGRPGPRGGEDVQRLGERAAGDERIDDPSTSMVRIWTRFSNGRLFMPRICVRYKVQILFVQKTELRSGPRKSLVE